MIAEQVAERAQALRQAFDATMKDKELLSEIETTKLEFEPMAGAELQALVEASTKVTSAALAAAQQGFDDLARQLGLGGGDPDALLGRIRARRAARIGLQPGEVEGKIEERMQARRDKDFARADAIRAEIAARGIELMDGPEGTSWRIP